MEDLRDKLVSIITCDGKSFIGTLRGSDQVQNVILTDCQERVYSEAKGVEQHVLGLCIIRGADIVLVGEFDEEKDATMDLSSIRAAPLKAVVH